MQLSISDNFWLSLWQSKITFYTTQNSLRKEIPLKLKSLHQIINWNVALWRTEPLVMTVQLHLKSTCVLWWTFYGYDFHPATRPPKCTIGNPHFSHLIYNGRMKMLENHTFRIIAEKLSIVRHNNSWLSLAVGATKSPKLAPPMSHATCYSWHSGLLSLDMGWLSDLLNQ